MRVIYAENVRVAYKVGMEHLSSYGLIEDSRAGQVLVAPNPVTTVYKYPKQRVLFNAARDANPFFHFFEGIWMLSGSNNGAFLDQFVGDFTSRFSDAGVTLHGAYGYRWRNFFGIDQIESVVRRLTLDPSDRRSVISMWDPLSDLGVPSKDIPCNTTIFFRVREGSLNMMVNCRSNDIIWGAYGANAVHFSMLQEYIASAIGASVGFMYQNSFNYHAYLNVFNKLIPHVNDGTWTDTSGGCVDLVDNPANFLKDCEILVGENVSLASALQSRNMIFQNVAFPMKVAHSLAKEKKFDLAVEKCQSITAEDWRRACIEWIKRRAMKETRRDGGEIDYGTDEDKKTD